MIPGRNPRDYGAAMAQILDDRELRDAMSDAAVERARQYTWHSAAERLRVLYDEISSTRLVSCEDPPVVSEVDVVGASR